MNEDFWWLCNIENVARPFKGWSQRGYDGWLLFCVSSAVMDGNPLYYEDAKKNHAECGWVTVSK